VTKAEYREGRGLYKVPASGLYQAPVEVTKKEEAPMTVELSAQVMALRQPKLVDESDASIPTKYTDYVPFGFFKDLRNIVKSSMFYPVFVTGLSGNGKTLMVEQVCAELQRECIRVNISIETDESDLLGGPTLVNGNVVNRDGPVIIAMKRGAVLLIDEVDRGSNKLMCLQGILEGKPYFNKKSGELVYPKSGFNVIATANTKGRGSDEGKYLSQILDDAFLERFPITVEQEYPDSKTETKILSPLIKDEDFIKCLVMWAEVVRKSFNEGATDEIISTRRLVHIAKAYEIFGDRMKAITLCVNRFDEETKTAFLDLYTKVDAKINADTSIAPNLEAKPTAFKPEEEVPF
jgi:cobaltochelatase CobS